MQSLLYVLIVLIKIVLSDFDEIVIDDDLLLVFAYILSQESFEAGCQFGRKHFCFVFHGGPDAFQVGGHFQIDFAIEEL